jgi:predicted metalloprotease
MRWDRSHRSNDVIDRRGERASGLGGGGGGGAGLGLLLMLVRSRFGWAGVAVLLVGYYILTSFSEGALTPSTPTGRSAASVTGHTPPPGDDEATFVGVVLDDVQATWTARFPLHGHAYRRAKLVLYTGATNTACGLGESATGPIYCPRDEFAYIDLGFNRILRDKLGAGGDFAQAYVIAHEIGHHVQHLLGTSERVARGRRGLGAEGDSVRLELQADCYAGVWAHDSQRRDLLEQGDIEEALTAAAAIGDDTLQRQQTGRVRPDSFSHGSSDQRVRWFKRGLESGDPDRCDTFAARTL